MVVRMYLPCYRQGVTQKLLPRILKELCDDFYDSTVGDGLSADRSVAHLPETSEGAPEHRQFQCAHCLSIYDPAYGDALAAVSPGLEFADLPEDYACGLCGAPKKDFTLANRTRINYFPPR